MHGLVHLSRLLYATIADMLPAFVLSLVLYGIDVED